MHKYLRSIGFLNLKKEELDQILYEASRKPDSYEVAMDSEGNEFAELRIEVASRMGLTLRGVYNNQDEFVLQQLMPYFEGDRVSIDDCIHIYRESDRESYMGLCEDDRLNFDMIFTLQNIFPLLREKLEHQDTITGQIALSGLSAGGKILLPVERTESQMQNVKKSEAKRARLIEAAKDGDPKAYEKLTLREMDTFSMITKRINEEDIFSIVNSFFMPAGIENDKYYLMGEIIDIEKYCNRISYETIYQLTLNCNGIDCEVCINKEDLLGEPEIGRRFKGNVWFQGRLLNV